MLGASLNQRSEKTPLGRMATEDDLKGAVAYLASDMSNMLLDRTY